MVHIPIPTQSLINLIFDLGVCTIRLIVHIDFVLDRRDTANAFGKRLDQVAFLIRIHRTGQRDDAILRGRSYFIRIRRRIGQQGCLNVPTDLRVRERCHLAHFDSINDRPHAFDCLCDSGGSLLSQDVVHLAGQCDDTIGSADVDLQRNHSLIK